MIWKCARLNKIDLPDQLKSRTLASVWKAEVRCCSHSLSRLSYKWAYAVKLKKQTCAACNICLIRAALHDCYQVAIKGTYTHSSEAVNG